MARVSEQNEMSVEYGKREVCREFAMCGAVLVKVLDASLGRGWTNKEWLEVFTKSEK